ncbi:hypothetical protein N0Y54_26235 [Nostoc punctiforme UO1]|uniref:hypothetical protein n=1 Tax=Nostoc punctiforme TaxID=272131 RepID=UPI0030982F0C
MNDFSYTMRMWDGEYAVGLQHLKSFNYLPAECEQMREICDACGGLRLRECIGGVGAEVFGVVGEAESGLFDYSGRKSVEYFGVGQLKFSYQSLIYSKLFSMGANSK